MVKDEMRCVECGRLIYHKVKFCRCFICGDVVCWEHRYVISGHVNKKMSGVMCRKHLDSKG